MRKTSNLTDLNDWYQKPLGSALLQSELVGLNHLLPQIFGYYIMQIGGPINNNNILLTSRIHNRIIVNPNNSYSLDDSLMVKCQVDELPFLPESIDVIILFHVLEFIQNPNKVLQEIYNVLMPNGHLIIFGFNPYSLWGLKSHWKKAKEIPQIKNWISPGTLRNCLDKLSYSIGDYKTFYFRPATDNTEKLLFLEGVGQIFWPYCGASYMFVATKKTIPIIPIKPILSFVKYFKTIRPIAKPTSRAIQCRKNQYE